MGVTAVFVAKNLKFIEAIVAIHLEKKQTIAQDYLSLTACQINFY